MALRQLGIKIVKPTGFGEKIPAGVTPTIPQPGPLPKTLDLYYYNGGIHFIPDPNNPSAAPIVVNVYKDSLGTWVSGDLPGGQKYLALTAAQLTELNLVRVNPSLNLPRSSNSTDNPSKSDTLFTGVYKYNAPMVSDAYFNILPNKQDSLYNIVDRRQYDDAKNAWYLNSDGSLASARGAIQMDRQLIGSLTLSDLYKNGQGSTKSKSNIDTTMKGFRFLYNPQTIQMEWGTSDAWNANALLYGGEKLLPAAPNTTSSTISFSIPLNRIQDMSLLNSDGSYIYEANPQTKAYTPADLAAVQKQGSSARKPYPYDVDQSERKLIYDKGTMYDVEWLFKTLLGLSGWVDHNDGLLGKTSDVGFIPLLPVELHLGNKLRYRVIIMDISINHIIFNPRMVPIWSVVQITAKRLPSFDMAKTALSGTGLTDPTYDTSNTSSSTDTSKRSGNTSYSLH